MNVLKSLRLTGRSFQASGCACIMAPNTALPEWRTGRNRTSTLLGHPAFDALAWKLAAGLLTLSSEELTVSPTDSVRYRTCWCRFERHRTRVRPSLHR